MENEFRDFEKSQKNIPKIIVKSGCGPRRFSPGGVLLTEFETSPLQVILNIARWRSALELQNRVLKARAGSKS